MASKSERRRWLKSSLAASLLWAWLPRSVSAKAQTSALVPTQSCADGATAAQAQGPYFTPDSPRRSMLLDRAEPEASPLHLTLKVVDTMCQPLPNTVVDLWCCDASGEYDNDGFHLRGHQVTDANGHCDFELIVPGTYGNAWFQRTPHLHVRVQAANGRPLTTQLYFPDHPLNRRDGLYDPTLNLATQADRAQFLIVL